MSFPNDIKHWWKNIRGYPSYHPVDSSYDMYWNNRDVGSLNSFQKARGDFALAKFKDNDSVLDLGCGDGRILSYLHAKNPTLHLSGIDSSTVALKIARERGLDVHYGDIRNVESLGDVTTDHIILFEVLEHIINSEELLAWANVCARKTVMFSVPNTGFFIHRLRLLFGKFPLQWRASPSEHVRFWTVRDMRWWMNQLGYSNYELHSYEGVSFLNRIIPSLFAAGIIVTIKK